MRVVQIKSEFASGFHLIVGRAAEQPIRYRHSRMSRPRQHAGRRYQRRPASCVEVAERRIAAEQRVVKPQERPSDCEHIHPEGCRDPAFRTRAGFSFSFVILGYLRFPPRSNGALAALTALAIICPALRAKLSSTIGSGGSLVLILDGASSGDTLCPSWEKCSCFPFSAMSCRP
jgi:hypothetical protein